MTNFLLLYVGAAVLALSAMLALAGISLWALGERRLRHTPQFRAVGFRGVGDEALALEVPRTAP
jgi:hypothetical protein